MTLSINYNNLYLEQISAVSDAISKIESGNRLELGVFSRALKDLHRYLVKKETEKPLYLLKDKITRLKKESNVLIARLWEAESQDTRQIINLSYRVQGLERAEKAMNEMIRRTRSEIFNQMPPLDLNDSVSLSIASTAPSPSSNFEGRAFSPSPTGPSPSPTSQLEEPLPKFTSDLIESLPQ